MIRVLSSLYSKLSAGYLLMLILFCAASVYFTVQTAERFLEESAQRLNSTLAAGLATEIDPFLGDSLDEENIKHAMHVLMVFNPWVEIYLLDSTGGIITYMAEPGEVHRPEIPVAPIEEFLSDDPEYPIRGIDPKSQTDEKIFSATRVQMGDRSGYLYVILHGKAYASAASMIMDSYILRGTAYNLGLLFVFTALAGVLLFGVLTRRFRTITRSVEAFASGDLDQRVDARSNDEIGRLGRSFNQMADTIQQNMVELKRRDDLRREFVANITHDLKSPLTSIKGYVETAMMKNDSLTADERLEYLQIIQEDTTILNNLVSQLLELAELEAPEIAVAREAFPAGDLVQDVIMKFQPAAKDLGVSLRTAVDTDLPMVCADIGMIERVLSNLVDNALRYTPEGGTIEVEGHRRNGSVQLEVRDTGYGIASEDLDRVTERFYKIRHQDARRPGGTGLGLSIVKRVLELHNSTLDISSEVGSGTKISFMLDAE
jgi:signal transduction histidine kinase